MRLASASDVLAAAGVVNVTPATTAHAEAMLDISLPLVESLLETTLARGSKIDAYHTGFVFTDEFRLSNGFIDAESVAVYAGPASGNPYSLVTAGNKLDSKYYAVNADSGVLAITYLPYSGSYTLAVTYEHGFAASADDEAILAVPENMKQIAIAAAVLAMNTVPSAPANRKEKTVSNVSRALYGYFSMALSPYRRPRLSVRYPDFSATYE